MNDGATTTRGDACEPPILLLYASFDIAAPWQTLAARLRARRRVLTHNVQERGHGAGVRLTALDAQAAGVQRLLDATPEMRGTAHVVAHGYAGAVALAWALRQPARAASLTLIEPLAFNLLGRGGGLLTAVSNLTCRMTEALARGAPERAARLLIDFWNGSGAAQALPPHWMADFAAQVGRITGGYHALLRSGLRADELRRLRMPLCLIGSLQSPRLLLEILRRINDTLPASRLHFVDGGHLRLMTEPVCTATIVEDFIAGCGGRRDIPQPRAA